MGLKERVEGARMNSRNRTQNSTLRESLHVSSSQHEILHRLTKKIRSRRIHSLFVKNNQKLKLAGIPMVPCFKYLFKR